MPDFIIRPDADTDFANATFHTGDTPLTATGLTNGVAHRAYVLSDPSAAFTPAAVVVPSAYASRASGSTPYITGPVLPAGVTDITAAIRGVFPSDDTGGGRDLFEWISQTFLCSLDNRSVGRSLSITAEDKTGADKIFLNQVTAGDVVPSATETEIAISIIQSNGTNSELRVFVDGVQIGSTVLGPIATIPANREFSNNRVLHLLNDPYAVDFARWRWWPTATTDGDLTDLGAPVVDLTAAMVLGDEALPAGYAVVGGAFT